MIDNYLLVKKTVCFSVNNDAQMCFLNLNKILEDTQEIKDFIP